MTEEQVALGSTNPVKERAAEKALPDVALRSVDVEPGVSEQPVGHAETRSGAENRASAAATATDSNVGLGIESGVARCAERDETHIIMWAAVVSGEKMTAASGPTIPLPNMVDERLGRGDTLGAIITDIAGTEARSIGAAGVFTDGVFDRESALATTVRAAWGRHHWNPPSSE